MTDEVNENSIEEVVQPSETEQLHDDGATDAQEIPDQKRIEEEKNWAEVRRKMREQQQLIEDSQRRIAELTTPKQTAEENWGINDDDLAEGKHIKELKKELIALKSHLKNQEAEVVNERVQLKFPDYQEVVTPENIELLKQKKPILAKALSRFDNQYELAVEAYDLIKTYVHTPEHAQSFEAKRAAENSAKPRSVQAVPKTSALADVNQFAEMDVKGKKAFLQSKYEEMRRAMKAG